MSKPMMTNINEAEFMVSVSAALADPLRDVVVPLPVVALPVVALPVVPLPVVPLPAVAPLPQLLVPTPLGTVHAPQLKAQVS